MDLNNVLMYTGCTPIKEELFMVALYNRADYYIFILWFLLLSIFFPRPSTVTAGFNICFQERTSPVNTIS